MNMAVNGDLSLSEVASNLWFNYKTLYNWLIVHFAYREMDKSLNPYPAVIEAA